MKNPQKIWEIKNTLSLKNKKKCVQLSEKLAIIYENKETFKLIREINKET